LLSSLTKLGRGWDYSEAWFSLARAYEESGQVGKAKEVLWWCVELEDTRPVRGWGVAGGWW
jgi:cargo-transport protein YPP1